MGRCFKADLYASVLGKLYRLLVSPCDTAHDSSLGLRLAHLISGASPGTIINSLAPSCRAIHGLPLPVLYHHLHGERFILPGLVANLHFQPDGADGLPHLGCVNAQPLGRDMCLSPGMQLRQAIQPGAAVPAGVGVLVIAHSDLQTVFFTEAQCRFQRYKKAPIPAVVFSQ